MTSDSFSVVICAYADDRWEALVNAIRSVERQETPAAEIVISVDHNPALAARAREYEPATVVVENDGPRGLSGARNSGIAVARGEIVAFLDDDAVATPEWLTYLGQGFQLPNVVGVGGPIEPAWMTARPGWFPHEFDWVVGCTYLGMPTITRPIRNLIGANMSFRREIFDAAGGFRSGIGRVGAVPFGCEETEFCIRVRQRFPQSTMLYEPQARILHQVPSHRGTWSYYVRRCYAEGRSKTMVARHVGMNDGLSSERHYTMRTLPRGVGRGLVDTVRFANPAGAARAGAIVAGLAITTTGFVVSQVAEARARTFIRRGQGVRSGTVSIESAGGISLERTLDGTPAVSFTDE